ncbi:hypothetical protein PtA15_1A617 [Puccinia triticina]|uniref:VASt domain-containing protein n=1 Tax=Puccinia triticina TaxID=208348 RepID=A0ABY7C9Y6_9BASI|nr:uncharacterized protein PtA15_1A617 [Puccinia triticina]WAQ81277.1 hypothetical protein PtA15_1A617 [Puccinia triticina]
MFKLAGRKKTSSTASARTADPPGSQPRQQHVSETYPPPIPHRHSPPGQQQYSSLGIRHAALRPGSLHELALSDSPSATTTDFPHLLADAGPTPAPSSAPLTPTSASQTAPKHLLHSWPHQADADTPTPANSSAAGIPRVLSGDERPVDPPAGSTPAPRLANGRHAPSEGPPIPVRPRAASYHTSPSTERRAQARPPLPPLPPGSQPGTPHSSLDSLASAAASPDEKDDRSVHTTDSRAYNLFNALDDQLGTGYAVASRKRNVDFHAVFKSIPEDDYLIEDYGCALQRDILVQGRLYISEQHLCFNANIFGWVTTLVIPFSDVVTVEKRMTALIIPNAIQVNTTQSRHTFASFLSRDATYDLMSSIWTIARPPGTAPTHGLTLDVTVPAIEDFSDGPKPAVPASSDFSSSSSSSDPPPKIDHPPTQCQCAPDEHYKELIWDATYPTSPEKLYNILFQSDFLKDFWVNEEHLTEIEVGDWTTSPEAKYPSRNVSYIRPVTAPVGPKTIKCLVVDEHRALDFDQYVSLLTTVRTPDAPAGGSFCVRTLTCISWGPNNSSRWHVTAAVEWTKVNRFLKSIIESSAISGQKAYQVGVDQALRKHIQLSQPTPEPPLGAGGDGDGYARLSSDVALTVKQALHEYFRDHPPLLRPPAERRVDEAPRADDAGQEAGAPATDPHAEIAQIEALLQSLEARIRRVRLSLVADAPGPP